MYTYRVSEPNDMIVDSSKNKKLYYDIQIDDNKELESGSDDLTADKYDESLIKDIIEKYLANKEKVMSEYELVNESKDEAELEEDKIESESSEAELDEEEEEAEEEAEEEYISSSNEYENTSEAENDGVKDLGSICNELILNSAMESYKEEFGKYPSLDILREGLSVAKAGLFNDLTADDYADINESDSENVMEFSNELEDALMIASDIGSIHQVYLVNRVLDTYYEINGKEGELDELKLIFSKIKNELEKEADEELLDLIEVCDSDDDSDDEDYIITEKDAMQAVLDDDMDFEYESEEDSSSSESEEESEENEFDEYENNVEDEYDSEDDEDDSDYDPEFDTQDYKGDYEIYQ